jgi:hypothetical protein
MRVKLTNRFVKSATTDGRKSAIFMDEVIGFGAQVRNTGRKSFTLDHMFEGRRRLYIGDFPDWSPRSLSSPPNSRCGGCLGRRALHRGLARAFHRSRLAGGITSIAQLA